MSDRDLRFFGRLRAAILECPFCGDLADIRSSALGRDKVKGPRKIQPGTFDPLTARWRCRGCARGGVLGIVLYLIDEREDDGRMPEDWHATIAQAAKLRELARGRLSGESWKQRRYRKGGRANQVRLVGGGGDAD
jgi:hypothetical protein